MAVETRNKASVGWHPYPAALFKLDTSSVAAEEPEQTSLLAVAAELMLLHDEALMVWYLRCGSGERMLLLLLLRWTVAVALTSAGPAAAAEARVPIPLPCWGTCLIFLAWAATLMEDGGESGGVGAPSSSAVPAEDASEGASCRLKTSLDMRACAHQ